MKVSLLASVFLSISANFSRALKVKCALHDLLFSTNRFVIKETVKSLFINYQKDFGLLLQLVFCEYFDFRKFMPDDSLLIRPIVELLRQRDYPREIEEQLYNFDALQDNHIGIKFLLDLNVNFARLEWNPDKFTREDVKEILLKVQNYPVIQFNHQLNINALSHVLLWDQSNFFGEGGRWNLFSISSFINHTIPKSRFLLWLEQIKPHLAKDDLLFYRLAYLSRAYYQTTSAELANIIWDLLAKSSSKGFRDSILNHYSWNGSSSWSWYLEPLLEIPNHVLDDNPVARATLHFEHIICAFSMKYRVSRNRIVKLFQTFEPSLVFPFLCRELLKHIKYRDFIIILGTMSPAWQKLYHSTLDDSSYFSRELLSVTIQMKLWRRQRLHIKSPGDSLDRRNVIYLNHPQSWQQYLIHYEEGIVLERDGFTRINCLASEKSIKAFMERKIVEFILFDEPLPKFALNYDLLDGDDDKGIYSNTNLKIEEAHIDKVCILKSGQQLTIEGVATLLDVIIKVFRAWKIPKPFFLVFSIQE